MTHAEVQALLARTNAALARCEAAKARHADTLELRARALCKALTAAARASVPVYSAAAYEDTLLANSAPTLAQRKVA